VLLEAIPSVLQVRSDVEFICAGPWFRQEEQTKAMGFIHGNGLDRFVTFTGAVTTAEDKQRLYESADLFVFPGVQQEGQPLVVLEAMAAGLPVIFTNRGCLRETVIQGHNGWEVPLHDSDAIARRILWFMTHAEARAEMGRASRLRYEQAYTREQLVSNLSRVLKSSLERHSRLAGAVASPVGKSGVPTSVVGD
jgi:glycosyltransferase involved in cell wall biosynthesis